MKTVRLAAALSLALIPALAAAAPAAPPVQNPAAGVILPPTGPLPVGGMTIEEIAAWLTSKGYAAQILPPSGAAAPSATTKLVGAVRTSESGTSFLVVPQDCAITTSRCRAMQLGASFNPAPERPFTTALANDWNMRNRYGKVVATTTTDGQPRATLTYDFNLSPGVNYEGIDDNFGVFRSILGGFRVFLATPPAPAS